MTDTFERSLELAFTEDFDAGAAASDAAGKATAFREEYDLDITAQGFTSAVKSAPYTTFASKFDYVIGDLAADIADCTDSREFRLAGFGDLSADPNQGA